MDAADLPPWAQAVLPAFLQQSKAEIHAKFEDLEWQQRNRLAEGVQAPTHASGPPSVWARLTGDEIAARNRYVNVEPFAQSRIKLRVSPNANDYINASPIQLGKRKYIATQGPKDTSVNHFYRMIIAETQDPAVVVMLTKTYESGREKCFQYYPLAPEESPLMIPEDPDFDDGFEGEVHLRSIEEHAQSRTEIRRMQVIYSIPGSQSSGQPPQLRTREVVHLSFSAWPDFLVPEGDDQLALVRLVRLSASLNRTPSSRPSYASIVSSPTRTTPPQLPTFASDLASVSADSPRIVHCSAGVGRSGTFIALDYLLSLLHTGQLDRMQPADHDPIAEVVDNLRKQRMMMVQGESQFYFLYDSIRRQFVDRLKQQRTSGRV